MLAVEVVEIIVMRGHCEEVASTRLCIASDQLFRPPVLRLPLPDDVNEASPARVSIMPEMVLVGSFAGHPRLAARQVHQPGVPVAPFGLALRAPMRPDSELGVPK